MQKSTIEMKHKDKINSYTSQYLNDNTIKDEIKVIEAQIKVEDKLQNILSLKYCWLSKLKLPKSGNRFLYPLFLITKLDDRNKIKYEKLITYKNVLSEISELRNGLSIKWYENIDTKNNIRKIIR